MVCDPKCFFTAALDGPRGRRLMISAGGKGKFPQGTLHPICDECASEQLEDARLGCLFDNNQEMIQRYKKMMKM